MSPLGETTITSGVDRAIQFLVCPQRDFIGRLAAEQEPPNRLHVGHRGVERLRGAQDGRDLFVETTRRFYGDDAEHVQVVIDEDWHPRSWWEFDVFGEHCIKGSAGAQLVGGLETYRWHARTHVLRANSINVAAHAGYQPLLESLIDGRKPSRVKVGAYGVWTNIKVEYLLLNLMTMAPSFPVKNLAVLEPLCACPDPTDHDDAIRKLSNLGVTIFRDVRDYLAWMGLSDSAPPA